MIASGVTTIPDSRETGKETYSVYKVVTSAFVIMFFPEPLARFKPEEDAEGEADQSLVYFRLVWRDG